MFRFSGVKSGALSACFGSTIRHVCMFELHMYMRRVGNAFVSSDEDSAASDNTASGNDIRAYAEDEKKDTHHLCTDHIHI